ncbi:MAG: biotin/lipoate A/B protein ligase family protein [Desulfobacteraceae bacterium]|nr:biotin/lipoate A/B protein ligase family protein [Desulfobacteraceae bacterium]
MAIDESLLCLFNAERSVPILRTYAWDPPSLSLGRFQFSGEALDLDRCCSSAVSVVRRVSGGGTIYHADELTYSVVCSPEQIPSTTSVKDSFRVLTGFLIDFYRRLGLNAHYAIDAVSNTERLGERTAFCFAGKESFDILIDGKKIGGNAQRRGRNVIFQHGSIPIINRAQQGLHYMKDRSPEYVYDTVSLSECGVSADHTTLKGLLVDAFRHHLGVATYVSDLSQEEDRLSQELMLKKYSSDRWNMQGEVE